MYILGFDFAGFLHFLNLIKINKNQMIASFALCWFYVYLFLFASHVFVIHSSTLFINPDATLWFVFCLSTPTPTIIAKRNQWNLVLISTFLRKENSGKMNCMVKAAKGERKGSDNGTDFVPNVKDRLTQTYLLLTLKDLNSQSWTLVKEGLAHC